MKKPIILHLTWSSPFLKTLRLRASMASSGKLFHLSTTRSEKKWRRRSRRHLFFEILAECARVLITELMVNRSLNDIIHCPVNIRKNYNRLAWFLPSSSVHNPDLFSRSSYDNCLKPGINRSSGACLSRNRETKLIHNIPDEVGPMFYTASTRYLSLIW